MVEKVNDLENWDNRFTQVYMTDITNMRSSDFCAARPGMRDADSKEELLSDFHTSVLFF